MRVLTVRILIMHLLYLLDVFRHFCHIGVCQFFAFLCSLCPCHIQNRILRTADYADCINLIGVISGVLYIQSSAFFHTQT